MLALACPYCKSFDITENIPYRYFCETCNKTFYKTNFDIIKVEVETKNVI